MSKILFPQINSTELPLGTRTRTELALESFNQKLSVTKSYHEPTTRTRLRRIIHAAVIDHDYVPQSPEEHISHEVERLRAFAKKGIRVPDIYEVRRRSYTMEFIPQASAKTHIENGNLKAIDNVLLALRDIHQTGLTHGDLFPANVLPMNEEVSVIIDPGMRYADQDSPTAKTRDLIQALFRIGHFVYEMKPVIDSLKTIYQDHETLKDLNYYISQTGVAQRLLINLVFKDMTIFSRMQNTLKSVFGKISTK